jgi:diguanylate cyclase (GGDEF)-like protein/PAS domain S-box-containing protein
MSKKSIKMLLVIEDNPGDARSLREMFNEQDLHNTKRTWSACPRSRAPRPLGGADGLGRRVSGRTGLARSARKTISSKARWTRAGFCEPLRYAVERKIMEEALLVEKERAWEVSASSISSRKKMTGWSWQEAAGRPMAEVLRILDATSREAIPNPMEVAVGQNRCVHLPSNRILNRRDGFEIPIEDSVSPIHDREGQATGAVIVFRNVSAARVTHSAQQDFLTGLPNRMLVNDRVSPGDRLSGASHEKRRGAVLGFGWLQTHQRFLGHPIGEKLLQSVAKRLVNCVRGADTVSRHGGDEFVVLLSELERSEDAAIAARKMLQAVAEAHSVDQHDLHVTTSIGVSVYPDDGLDAEAHADTAMYQTWFRLRIVLLRSLQNGFDFGFSHRFP